MRRTSSTYSSSLAVEQPLQPFVMASRFSASSVKYSFTWRCTVSQCADQCCAQHNKEQSMCTKAR
eukprot:2984-Heterococcus_DN1.PRE.9